jgi:transglutaminase-like putative cysteine protease
MHYSIVHITKFRYSGFVSESVMELRLHPRTDETQRCLQFALSLNPAADVFDYSDHLGNAIHHFDIPKQHKELEITTRSLVEVFPKKELPESLSPDAWNEVDALTEHNDFWDFLIPSEFAKPTDSLLSLANEFGLQRRNDPLTVLKELNEFLYDSFSYNPETTHVHSPIDEAMGHRSGVCQDFSNIMIAIVREMKIPCRYVSGYLFHRDGDRSHVAEDSTHAWVEAYLPSLGWVWVGFDPTNNILAGERHIRIAVGRDYADVPPTRGVFKGQVDSELSVAVKVLTADLDEIVSATTEIIKMKDDMIVARQFQQSQQQQQ